MMPTLLTIAAIIPGIILMVYTYKNDRVEKEPIGLLLTLMVGGALAFVVSAGLEIGLEWLLNKLFFRADLLYFLLDGFICIALVEEGCKLFITNRLSWNNKNFNCTYDGLIYAVAVTLGFAIAESLFYAARTSFSWTVLHGVTSVPAHMAFGVIMGLFYSKAKLAYIYHEKTECNANILCGLAISVVLHGFYIYCLLRSSTLLMICWYVLLVIMYIFIFRIIKAASQQDTYFALKEDTFLDDEK